MMKKFTLNLCSALAVALLTPPAFAQFTISDAGSTSPTPGANDVYAIYDNYQNNDGINYYWDSNVGQTFTTGANPSGYTLTNLAVRTAGNGGGWQVSQTFSLIIYSVDGSGNATPIQTNTATGILNVQGDWLQWSGLSVPLSPNTLYAYAFNRGNNGSWEQMANNGSNPYAGGQICRIPAAGGAVAYGGSGASDAIFNIGLAPGTVSGGTVAIADIGQTAPTPGANDISQLLPAVIPMQNNYGLNYYWDSGPGQVFTTPSSSLPWVMTNLFIKTGGNGGGGQLGAQAFVLRIYSVSGSTATLIYSNSYTSALNADNNWLQCSSMNVVLQPNQQYAYTFNRGANGSWEQMANYDGNPYSGGRMCLIPPAGGTINYGSQSLSGAASSDAAFDVGLSAPLVFANVPTYSPNVSPIYAGTTLTLNEAALGSGLSYQWQTDGGSGGSLTNIPGATSSNLVVNTTAFSAGTYNYAVVVTTTSGGGMSTTSPALPLTVVAASAPILVTDTTPSPNTTSSYVGVNQSFSASFTGTLPIRYQWYVATDAIGTGATAVSGATNATLTLTNLQLSNSGYYSLQATNTVSPYTASSTWAQMDVQPASQMLIHWQTPAAFNGLTASQILTGTLPNGFTFFEGAFFGNAASPINVTNNGVIYLFYGDGSTVSLAGQSGTATGCWLVGGNTTGNTNLDQVLNQFAWDGGTHTITLHNLTPGSNYCVQIFALDDRAPGAGRYTTFQDPASNADVSDAIGMQDNKYVIGTFTAQGTDLAILQNLLPGGAGNSCAVIVGNVLSVNLDPATANFHASVSGSSLNFTWAPDHLGWQLYTNAVSLTATNSWFPVPGSANGTNQTITIDPTKPGVFFQLRYP